MAKREPRWVAVFLKQLERTGNVRVAAERAGVDHTTPYQRRKMHAGFAERWEGALAAARARTLTPLSSAESPAARSDRLGDGPLPGAPAGGRGIIPSPGSPKASPTSPSEGGDELIVRPDGHGGAALVRAGPNARWGKRAEERFLATLAETANVRQAAAAAGVSTVAVYARRLKHTDFAEAWELALDTGKAKLEAMLVEAAQRRFDPDALPISENEPQVSVGEALHIVKLKRSEPGRGPANGGGRQPYIATPEEVEQALIKRLKIFAKRVEQQDLEEGWSRDGDRMIPPGWVKIEDARCAKCGAELEESGPPRE